jgi:hypothetical protein
MMQLVQESHAIVKLISYVLPMSEIQTACEISALHQCAKILLKPWV